MVKKLFVPLFLLIGFYAGAQQKAFIKLVEPTRDFNTVRGNRQFIVGSTCKGCTLTANGTPVKVYKTGGFAYEVNLTSDATIDLVASGNGQSTRQIQYKLLPPVTPDTVKTMDIARIETYPDGDLVVQPGDRIRVKVKSLPGATVKVNGTELYEQPITALNKMPGIYQGEYLVRDKDSFSLTQLTVSLTDTAGNTISKKTTNKFSLLSGWAPDMVITKGRLAHLLFGTGEDRLGGAKIGYIDSMIPLRILGKVGSNYKVRLSKYRSAYIPDDVVSFMPKGSYTPESLTANWRIYGDSVFDYVSIGLFERLPYQSIQLIDPSRIVVDIFGATNNTNWIIQLQNTKEIKNAFYEQIEDDVLRVTVELKHPLHWGHQLYYNGNNLVLRIKRQPEKLSLNNLRIAIDAGHGGSNTGAYGPTGSSEKMLALDVSLKLQKALQQQGAKVIMTRTYEKFVDNKERILIYRDSLPDLLISIHLNSSGDPINAGGTSTYYRYIGFRPLSQSIYKRMLELGLKDYGNVGSFNFMLNSPTEYPNALVEMLFLSNPAEEELIVDENFQQSIADKIVQGIKDYLQAAEKER